MYSDFPLFDTERLVLRRFNDADTADVFRALSNPAVIKYYGVSYPTLESTRQQMEWFAQIEHQGTGTWWAICSRENKVLFGAIGLYFIKKEHQKAEMGFWLLPEYWGRGLVVEAFKPVFNYGLEALGLHRIEAFVESDNTNCKKLMNKLGFSHEGMMRDCEIKHGRFISLDVYARLKNKMVKP